GTLLFTGDEQRGGRVAPSRRQFIARMAAAGGLGAAYSAMQTLGLASAAFAAPARRLAPRHGTGVRVAVLGAGIAGLVAAYRLERAGFSVVLLEARRRTGGRNWTLRHGDRIEMIGEADQTARFSKGLYFNAGPARIPSHHQGLLGYCKELGVPLEVEVNFANSAYLQSDRAFGGRPVQQRREINDLRGQLSELLSKAIDRGALNHELTPDDKEKLVAFLRGYGDLKPDATYAGSERSGYAVAPGAFDRKGVALPPLTLRALLDDEALGSIMFDQNIVFQAPMFEPAGGMDRIPAAFHRAIRSPLLLDAEVKSIRQDAAKATIAYRERGRIRALTADYLIVTIPLPVLAKLDTDFAPPVKAAIANAVYDHSAKIAFEAPRFWEAEQIYGGLSFGSTGTGPVWYPSSGFHAARGIILGAYVSGKPAAAFEALPLAAQIDRARAAVDRLHPGHGADLAAPAAVNWSKVPFNLGPWIHWEPDGADAYKLLNQPEGRIYFSGAHLSQLPSWQEGAVAAAHRTVEMIAARVAASRKA
ncbi:MAG TPA: FAD-dependent oxidoreductase, partial [Rhizomicrobium sp.]